MSQDGYHKASECPVIGYGQGHCNKCLPEPEPKSSTKAGRPEAKNVDEDHTD